MMISTKLSLQNLALVLVVFTVFTVSLTETIQISDGLSAYSSELKVEMEQGETDMIEWGIVNTGETPIDIEFYATGPGSELLVFEQYNTIPEKSIKLLEVYVQVPEDHQDKIELRPIIHALQRGSGDSTSGASMITSVQMNSIVFILIGDDPIYTPPVVVEKEELPEAPKKEVFEPEYVEEESLEDKLAKIKASNLAKEKPIDGAVLGETPAEATGQFEVDEPVLDYVPEPGMDADLRTEINPVGTFSEEEEGGGCLIATATFGSEMAPQVQLLREIRDNQLMNTGSGMAFMSGFNSLYYSFSPSVADMERESPLFKELVKLTITPMISTLSIMEYADSEDKVLGLGIGVILMNLGMYVGLPTFGIVKLIQFRKN